MQNYSKKYMMTIMVILWIISIQAQEQQVRMLIKQVETGYTHESYHIDMNYAFYPSYISDTPFQSYTGSFKKEGASVILTIDQTEMAYSNGYAVIVSHQEKAVIAQKALPEEQSQKSPTAITHILPWIEKYELKETNTQYICTLYTAEVTPLDYSKLKLVIDKKSNTLVKQISYFNQQKQYTSSDSKEVFDYPRMEIGFSTQKPLSRHIQLSDYISIQSSGELKLAANINNYEIITQ